MRERRNGGVAESSELPIMAAAAAAARVSQATAVAAGLVPGAAGQCLL